MFGMAYGPVLSGQTIDEFGPVDGPFSHAVLELIATGPDANLWLTLSGRGDIRGQNRLFRMTTVGVATAALFDYIPDAIAAGPDGLLWITGEGNGPLVGLPASWVIARISPIGFPAEPPTYFPLPDGTCATYIARGPDGAMWFTCYADLIGRITLDGLFSFFRLPPGRGPLGITAGPDGDLWFTENAANRIGRLTPTGELAEFPIPTAASDASLITAGLDGNLWFLEQQANEVGRVTTAGVITEFPVPGASSRLKGIAAGPDGNIWFTKLDTNELGRITPSGEATLFSLPSPGSYPLGITAGPDGNIWFVESGYRVGRLTLTRCPRCTRRMPFRNPAP